MSDAVLVLNAGSSSIKLGVFELAHEPTLLCNGLLDQDAAQPRLVLSDPNGKPLFERAANKAVADEGRHLFADVLDIVEQLLGKRHLRAVGHRIVHGGADYSGPTVLTGDVVEKLRELTDLAPLHQPRCLASVDAIKAIRPDLTQIGCFDTAFHHGLAPPVSRFAIPRNHEENGIRRYGFHGLSFEYVAGRLAEVAPHLVPRRTVIAHLGNGASLCALRHGRSVDTTMGLTPLDGLVMGTRCGAIDPGVLLYLLGPGKMPLDRLQHMLYHECGLLGVSGISSDMRALLSSDQASAREAIDLFTLRAAQEVAAMTATLGGLDGLVFTGGIGEHSKEIRGEICARLGWFGLCIDAAANDGSRERISNADSAVEIYVIPTDEDMAIARHCAMLLEGGSSGEREGNRNSGQIAS
jgi:acetate kinase